MRMLKIREMNEALSDNCSNRQKGGGHNPRKEDTRRREEQRKKIPFFMSIGLRAASPSFIHVSDFHAESRPLLPLYSNATDIKVNVIIRPDLQNI